MTVQDLVSNCRERFGINNHVKCRIFDSNGGELSDDDIEYLNSEEPLFFSQGEEFSKTSTLALYKELKKLGQGGFGSVYLYKHTITKDDVAIKFIDFDSLNSTEDVNRVFSEMVVLRGLKHPNIVQLHDAFTTNDKVCLVMEFCSGGELSHYLEDHGKLPESEVYSISCQMIEAIRYCHNSKVVHRDLKLENILFSDETHSQIKIVDFGIAGIFGPNNRGERSDAGSLLYLAPEVLSGEDNRANPALDVWSLGCILYNLLTGKYPFDGESREEIVKKIQSGRFRKFDESISKPWHVLVNGMLRLAPNKRWNILRISEHLYKHRYEDEASLTEDSDVPVSPPMKPKKSNNFLKVKSKTIEESKKKTPVKKIGKSPRRP
jgi:serine/threonine protein kinase